MKLVVEIEGLKPLLMHSPKSMFEQVKTGRKGEEYDPAKEAEEGAYRDKEGYLVIPAGNIVACMLKASKLFKLKGRRTGISTTDMLKGSITVVPDEVRILDKKSNPLKEFEVHRALAVIQRARIIRCRPLIREWSAKFEVVWNPTLYGLTPLAVKDVIKQMGFIGLLDWRPQFGIFAVKSVAEIE